MIDLDSVRGFFARAPFMVELDALPTLNERVLAARPGPTPAMVQPA